MTATEYTITDGCNDGDTDGGGKFIFGLIAVALLAFFIWAGAQIISNVDVDTDLPLTRHAQTSHVGQTWRAETIQEYMKSCTPNEYICPNGVRVKWCEIKPGLSIGLFVGEQVKQVISGFAARTEYWKNRGGCQ